MVPHGKTIEAEQDTAPGHRDFTMLRYLQALNPLGDAAPHPGAFAPRALRGSAHLAPRWIALRIGLKYSIQHQIDQK